MLKQLTNQEARIIRAKLLLEMGARHSVISRLLINEFQCSRATSYRDIDKARLDMDSENLHDWVEAHEPVSLEDRNFMAEMSIELASHACNERDIGGFSTACKEYERLMRMGGKVFDTSLNPSHRLRFEEVNHPIESRYDETKIS